MVSQAKQYWHLMIASLRHHNIQIGPPMWFLIFITSFPRFSFHQLWLSGDISRGWFRHVLGIAAILIGYSWNRWKRKRTFQSGSHINWLFQPFRPKRNLAYITGQDNGLEFQPWLSIDCVCSMFSDLGHRLGRIFYPSGRGARPK